MPYRDPTSPEARESQRRRQERYRKTRKGLETQYRWRRTEAGRALRVRQNRMYVERNREKKRARQALMARVARGTMVRPDRCEECGRRRKIEGHHHDYGRPFDVRWLCRDCHRQEHKREDPADA